MIAMGRCVEEAVSLNVFTAQFNQIPCIAYVINLAVQTIIQDALNATAPENELQEIETSPYESKTYTDRENHPGTYYYTFN